MTTEQQEPIWHEDSIRRVSDAFDALFTALHDASATDDTARTLIAQHADAASQHDDEAMQTWAKFLRRMHEPIARGGAVALLHHADAHGDRSPVSQAVEVWLQLERMQRPWFRRVGRPVDHDAEPDVDERSEEQRRVRWMAFNARDKRLFVLDGGGRLRIFDGQTGDCVSSYETGIRNAVSAAIRNHGERLVVVSGDHIIYEWLTAAGLRLERLHAQRARHIAVSHDGRFVAVGIGTDLEIYDTSNWSLKHLLVNAQFTSLQGVSGDELLAMDDRGRAVFYSLATGTVQLTLSAPEGVSFRAPMRRHDEVFLFATDEGALKAIEIELGNEALHFGGHEGAIHGIASAKDVSFVVSVGDDRMLRAWDRAQATAFATWEGDAPLTHVTLSNDGLIAVADVTGNVLLFR